MCCKILGGNVVYLSQLDSTVLCVGTVLYFQTTLCNCAFVCEEVGHIVVLATLDVWTKIAVAVVTIGHTVPVADPLVGDVAGIHC